jgi:hypothetical protein
MTRGGAMPKTAPVGWAFIGRQREVRPGNRHARLRTHPGTPIPHLRHPHVGQESHTLTARLLRL